jgi:hypothetical protein
MKSFDKTIIRRDMINHSAFRTALHVFVYDEMSLSVYHENLLNQTFIRHLMFVQAVNSKQDAIEFIDAYLTKVGTR